MGQLSLDQDDSASAGRARPSFLPLSFKLDPNHNNLDFFPLQQHAYSLLHSYPWILRGSIQRRYSRRSHRFVSLAFTPSPPLPFPSLLFSLLTLLSVPSLFFFPYRVGNVPQLTVDIVISTLPNLRRVGYLSSLDLVPFLGGPEEPSKDQGVVTALEVFGVLDQDDGSYMDTFWVQQRSPVLKVRASRKRVREQRREDVSFELTFFSFFFLFCSCFNRTAKKLISPPSSHGSDKLNSGNSCSSPPWTLPLESTISDQSQPCPSFPSLSFFSPTHLSFIISLRSPSKHHHLPLPSVLSLPFPGPLSTSYPAYSSSSFEDPLTAPLPTISAHPIPGATSTSTTVTQPPPPSTVLPPLPGSGILSPLLLQLNASVPTGVVLSFVVEGDNRADAREMAGVVDVVLDLGVGRDGAGGWREPESWEGLGREEAEGRREW